MVERGVSRANDDQQPSVGVAGHGGRGWAWLGVAGRGWAWLGVDVSVSEANTEKRSRENDFQPQRMCALLLAITDLSVTSDNNEHDL